MSPNSLVSPGPVAVVGLNPASSWRWPASGATGHTLGAAGGLEAIATVKAIETKTLPPTINYETPDPDCDLSYVPNKVSSLSAHPLDISVADVLYALIRTAPISSLRPLGSMALVIRMCSRMGASHHRSPALCLVITGHHAAGCEGGHQHELGLRWTRRCGHLQEDGVIQLTVVEESYIYTLWVCGLEDGPPPCVASNYQSLGMSYLYCLLVFVIL